MPTPDRDLGAPAPAAPFYEQPWFWIAIGVAGLALASSISQRGPKIGAFDPSRRRRY